MEGAIKKKKEKKEKDPVYLSGPYKEMYEKQYGEFAYRCLGVEG